MNCKNCYTELEEHDDYCRSCGGRVVRNRLTFKNLFEHVSETFFNYDNTLLKTFLTLFRTPEAVIDGYIEGTRKKYVNVISYFALAITISGLYMFIINKYFPEVMDFSFMSAPGQEEFQKKNMAFVQEYQSIIMMLYVPIYALMARLVFFNIKKYNYTELLVVFLYIQAQISIVSAIVVVALAIIGLNTNILGIATLPLMVIYSAYCLKRLYNLNTLDIIVRTLLFLVVLGITFFIITIVMLGVMFFTGELQEMFEAGKKAAEEAAKTKSAN
ncbi:DUF3667 domain-containing protein [Winogradskyella forsetii]|uniref:DUF3667 domain-containing protein n=1 Tax=Winogradskyella forsetii TaxID=2686077 RepID=UPI0015B7F4FC|nr:DUF3667 domain-containing protein [Winogradskyella forsetii]